MGARGAGQGTAGPRLVVAFLNSTDCPACRAGDAFASPRTFRSWQRAQHADARERASERDLARLRRFRDEIRALVLASIRGQDPPPSAVGTVNAALRRSRPGTELVWAGDSWKYIERDGGAAPGDRLARRIARELAELLTGPRRAKLRRCRGRDCAHFLFARTSTQLWCSATGCGNRARAARHYRRVRREEDRDLPGPRSTPHL